MKRNSAKHKRKIKGSQTLEAAIYTDSVIYNNKSDVFCVLFT